jgi:aminomethyltransferase
MAKPEEENLIKTALYDLHVAKGARMVAFGGFLLPIQYKGIVVEHKHTRSFASIFDVSHMGQISITGSDFKAMAKGLEALIPADILSLEKGEMRYSVLLNEVGGVVDDLIITRDANDEAIFIVVNAATKDNDLTIFQNALGAKSDIKLENDKSLIALQGPKAAKILSCLSNVANEIIFMQSAKAEIKGIKIYVSRSGYTGEDGFEISVLNKDAAKLVEILLEQDEVELAGLGARDSLRLEAGLCLYGHDMDENIDPISAGIIFALGKNRRLEGGFIGADAVQRIIVNGVREKRIGIIFEGRMPVREGALLIDENGKNIGRITSGGFSPILEKPIAFGYLSIAKAKIGEKVCALVRGKQVFGIIVKMPFVKQNYKRSL